MDRGEIIGLVVAAWVYATYSVYLILKKLEEANRALWAIERAVRSGGRE